jgi:hypothetical protein
MAILIALVFLMTNKPVPGVSLAAVAICAEGWRRSQMAAFSGPIATLASDEAH